MLEARPPNSPNRRAGLGVASGRGSTVTCGDRFARALPWTTGLRSNDAKTVRWEHVDFEAGTLHRPMPEGGEDRAFTVPVSEAARDILRDRREENAIIFPRKRRMGLAEQGPARARRARHAGAGAPLLYARRTKVSVLLPPHRLCDTFASAAHEAGVDPLSRKALLNQRCPAAATSPRAASAHRWTHLRAAAERVAAFLLEKIAGEG